MSAIPARLTLDALRSILADNDRCLALFTRWRFPDGFLCPACGSRRAFHVTSRHLWQCHECRKQVSVTSGTVLHRTRLPLRHWLYAIWMLANRKQSISALQLQKELGLGSYETAWALLHKVRRALRQDPSQKLEGLVNVGETLLPHHTLRHVSGGAAIEHVAVAVERRASGQLRFRCGLRDPTDKLDDVCSAPRLPRLERRWGTEPPIITTVLRNLRSWLDGTFHGVTREYLRAYLDEFAWRFNHRSHEPALWADLGVRLLAAPFTPRAQIRRESRSALPV